MRDRILDRLQGKPIAQYVAEVKATMSEEELKTYEKTRTEFRQSVRDGKIKVFGTGDKELKPSWLLKEESDDE